MTLGRSSEGPTNASARAILTIEDEVAYVTLNRPERLNAIDVAMAERLRDIGREITAMDTVRVVVVRGAGSAFCAGGDIEAFAARLGDMDALVTTLLTAYHEFLTVLAESTKLVVTSVHGAAAGAGLSLAAMGDLCIASEDARFTPAYAKLGVSPDGGGTMGLVRAFGARRALQVFLAEDHFTAAQGAAWGLVCEVVAPHELADTTARLAKRLARIEPAAASATKTLIRHSGSRDLAEQLDAEMRNLIACMGTAPFEKAVHDFVGRSSEAPGDTNDRPAIGLSSGTRSS